MPYFISLCMFIYICLPNIFLKIINLKLGKSHLVKFLSSSLLALSLQTKDWGTFFIFLVGPVCRHYAVLGFHGMHFENDGLEASLRYIQELILNDFIISLKYCPFLCFRLDILWQLIKQQMLRCPAVIPGAGLFCSK